MKIISIIKKNTFKVQYLASLICLTTVLIFTSCVSENIIEGDGYVFDAKTNKPLDSVLVKSYYKYRKRSKQYQMEMITDTTGYFFGTTGLVGCGGDCPELIIELIKSGYTTKEIMKPIEDTVFLNK